MIPKKLSFFSNYDFTFCLDIILGEIIGEGFFWR